VRRERESRQKREDALYCLGALLDKIEDLVKLCGEEIEGCEDATVRTEIVPLRDDLSGGP
jgi:hypothetical protein